MFALASCSSLGTQVKSPLTRAIFAEPLDDPVRVMAEGRFTRP